MRDDIDVRSIEEMTAAIAAFTDADWVRLEAVSNRYAWLYPEGADPLLWEAIARALVGSRLCPRDVDAVRFLAEAMRSIADGEAKKKENTIKHSAFDEAGLETAAAVRSAQPQQSPEDMMISTQTVDNIRQTVLGLFDDDPQARDLADGIMEGCDGEELRALTDLDKREFVTKRRLFRRRLDKARAQGKI